MIPVSTVISRIRTRYEAESGGSSVRWTDAELLVKVRDALETLAEYTDFYERYCTVPVQANRLYYDVRGFTPETVVSITDVWSSTRNDWLDIVTVDDLPFDFESASGDPQCIFTRGIYWIGIYPRPSSTSTGYLRVYFSGVPAGFTHLQAVLSDLPDDYVVAVEDYVLYEMAGDDGNPKLSLVYWASYQKREKDLRDFIKRRLVGVRATRLGAMAGRL